MNSVYRNSQSFISTLVAAIVIVAMIAIFSSIFLQSPPPKVQVNGCSLSSGSVSVGQIDPLSISLQSNDAQNSHSIQIEFSSNSRVSFLVGSTALAKNGNVWFYSENLDSKEKITNQVNVVSSLEEGVAKITYQVTVTVFSDGQQIFTKNLDLTVQSS